MMDEKQVQELIFRAIDRVNEVLLDENLLPKDLSFVLLGDMGALDSMGFVNFIVALEEELAIKGILLNVAETLNDPNYAACKPATVGEFIEFVFRLVQIKAAGVL